MPSGVGGSTVTTRWHILALGDGDAWEADDIVVAMIDPTNGSFNNWMIAQVLKSDLLGIGGTTAVEMYPFKVEVVPNEYKVIVYTGSVSNVIATYSDGSSLHGTPTTLSTSSLTVPSGTSQIYLKITSSGTTFPLAVTVEAAATMPTDTATEAYVRVCQSFASTVSGIKYVTLGNPYVKTSLWADRIKTATQTQTYFWRT